MLYRRELSKARKMRLLLADALFQPKVMIKETTDRSGHQTVRTLTNAGGRTKRYSMLLDTALMQVFAENKIM